MCLPRSNLWDKNDIKGSFEALTYGSKNSSWWHIQSKIFENIDVSWGNGFLKLHVTRGYSRHKLKPISPRAPWPQQVPKQASARPPKRASDAQCGYQLVFLRGSEKQEKAIGYLSVAFEISTNRKSFGKKQAKSVRRILSNKSRNMRSAFFELLH